MALFRLVLVAYFVARCAGTSMGVLPTPALDDGFAESASSGRIQRHCHFYQGDGPSDDDEVATAEIDDDFLPALAPEPRPAMHPNRRALTAPQATPYRVFLDGVFRPPQVTA